MQAKLILVFAFSGAYHPCDWTAKGQHDVDWNRRQWQTEHDQTGSLYLRLQDIPDRSHQNIQED